MGEAIVEGLLRSGWIAPETVTVVERGAARREELCGSGGLANRYPGVEVVGSEQLGSGGTLDGAIVAVKPGDVEGACAALAQVGVKRVVSVAAGVTLARLEGWLAGGAPSTTESRSEDRSVGEGGNGVQPSEQWPAVIRAMPNTPSLVGAGAAAISAGRGAGPDDIEWAKEILGSIGTVVAVPEALMDAVTGLSGSGPAYVFMLVEAMVDAGVLVGLPRRISRDLVVQTLLGSARLLDETGEAPEALRAAVTSPGGTTAAGLRALEAGGLRSAVLEAVSAAVERSRQIAGV